MKVEIEIPKLLYETLEQYRQLNGIEDIESCIYNIVSDTLYLNQYGDINSKIKNENIKKENVAETNVKKETVVTPLKTEKEDVEPQTENVNNESCVEEKSDNKVNRIRRRTLKAK